MKRRTYAEWCDLAVLVLAILAALAACAGVI
jgi:hypothetical protein